MLLPLPSGERSPGRDVLWDRGPPAAKPSCLHILWAVTLTALPHSALLESAPEETTRPFLRLGLLEDTDQDLEFTKICVQGTLSISDKDWGPRVT